MASTEEQAKNQMWFPELVWAKDYVIWRGPLMASSNEAREVATAAKACFAPCVTADNEPGLAASTSGGPSEAFALKIPRSEWYTQRGAKSLGRRALSPMQFAERVAREMGACAAANHAWGGAVEIAGNPVWRYRCEDEATARRLASHVLHKKSRAWADEQSASSAEAWWPMVSIENKTSQVRDTNGDIVSCATEAEAWRHAAMALSAAVISVAIEEPAQPIVDCALPLAQTDRA